MSTEKSDYEKLKEECDRYRQALERIEDPTTAIRECTHKRRACSYADWELRSIARHALKPELEIGYLLTTREDLVDNDVPVFNPRPPTK